MNQSMDRAVGWQTLIRSTTVFFRVDFAQEVLSWILLDSVPSSGPVCLQEPPSVVLCSPVVVDPFQSWIPLQWWWILSNPGSPCSGSQFSPHGQGLEGGDLPLPSSYVSSSFSWLLHFFDVPLSSPQPLSLST